MERVDIKGQWPRNWLPDGLKMMINRSKLENSGMSGFMHVVLMSSNTRVNVKNLRLLFMHERWEIHGVLV